MFPKVSLSKGSIIIPSGVQSVVKKNKKVGIMLIKEKFSDFFSGIREVLGDTKGSYYTDSQVALCLRDAFNKMYSIRPSTRFVGQDIINVIFPKDDSLMNFEITYDEKYRLGLIYFAASRCYESDIKDLVHQQLSAQLRKQAEAEFLS